MLGFRLSETTILPLFISTRAQSIFMPSIEDFELSVKAKGANNAAQPG